jgi:hypothetical protein
MDHSAVPIALFLPSSTVLKVSNLLNQSLLHDVLSILQIMAYQSVHT